MPSLANTKYLSDPLNGGTKKTIFGDKITAGMADHFNSRKNLFSRAACAPFASRS
jgi:hypothetical protein